MLQVEIVKQYTHVCDAGIYTYTHTYIYTYIHTYMSQVEIVKHSWEEDGTDMFAMQAYIHTRIHIYTYTHTYMQTYIHTYMSQVEIVKHSWEEDGADMLAHFSGATHFACQ